MHIGEGTKLGPYRVLGKLGEGGMGAVYQAVHERLQKRVAIKTLHEAIARDAEAVGRFVREGRAASRIRHAHVVDVTDVGVEEGTPYLVMEMLDGESLAALLTRVGPLAIPTIVDIALPVLDALQAAHAAGVVHRDLKPENVFLSRSRGGGELHPIVLDFGISWIEDEVRLTKTAHFMGTPFYMSPEQAQSARSVDARSDQFSLGLVLFELVTGRRALSGQSVLEIVHRVSTEGAPRLSLVRPDLPPAFSAIVDRMTERRPDARFASMREVGSALLPFASPRAAAVWGAAFSGGGLVVQANTPSFAPPFHAASPGTPSSSTPAFSTPSSSAAGFADTRSSTTPSSASPSSGAPAFSAPRPYAHGLATDPTVSAAGGPPSSSVPPATTTLRGAARESVASPARPRGSVVFAVISMIALIGTIVLAYVVGSTLARQAAATAAPPVAAVAPAPPPVAPEPAPLPATIDVRLRAIPPVAEIVLDGTVVGTGSYSGDLPRDGIPHVLEVRAAGYVPHHIQFLDIAPVAQIELDRIPRHHRGPIEPHRSHMTEAGLVTGASAPPPTAAIAPAASAPPATAPIAAAPPIAPEPTSTPEPPPVATAPRASTATTTEPAAAPTAPATATAPTATAAPATAPTATAPPPEPEPADPPAAPAAPAQRDDGWGAPRTDPDLIPFD